DPHAPAFQAVVVVHRLFREPSVGGKRIAKQLFQCAVSLEIGLRDRIVVSLGANLEPAASPITAQDLAGNARGLLCEREFARQIIFFHCSFQPRKSYLHLGGDSIAEWFAFFAISNLSRAQTRARTLRLQAL